MEDKKDEKIKRMRPKNHLDVDPSTLPQKDYFHSLKQFDNK